MDFRRVITGQRPEAEPEIVVDETVAPMTPALLPGWEFHTFWGFDTPPTAPNPGQGSGGLRWFPETPGGVRFFQCTIPPDATPQPELADVDAAVTEAETLVPGLIGVFEPDAPGMHRTDSIDFLYIISGRCILDLDNGRSVELGPQDTIVQNGTRHAWRNPFDEPCRLLAVLLGVSPATGHDPS